MRQAQGYCERRSVPFSFEPHFQSNTLHSIAAERNEPFSSTVLHLALDADLSLRIRLLQRCIYRLPLSASRLPFEAIREIPASRELQKGFDRNATRRIEPVRPGAVLEKCIFTSIRHEIDWSATVRATKSTDEDRKQVFGKRVQRHGIALRDTVTELA
jgi:hypothetical protein